MSQFHPAQLAFSYLTGLQATEHLMVDSWGTWMLYSGGYSGGSSVTGSTSRSHEETVVFDGCGSFQYQSSSSFMLNTPGSGGSYSGGAGSASSDSDQGTYTVIDRTLVLKGTKGQFAVDIQLQGDQLVAGGKTYLRSR